MHFKTNSLSLAGHTRYDAALGTWLDELIDGWI